MSILAALYQELIVEHQKRPRNFGKPEMYTHAEEGVNPGCGDAVTMYISTENDTITDLHFTGEGCAISQAAASILTLEAKGKSIDQVQQLYEQFMAMLQGETPAPELGDLAVFQGVAKVPARVKCAALAFSAIRRSVLR